ncbi:uncharacterized protein LOC108912198 [Anoplophora glabripennis]|uniref:uncharacterized protein LOC108912198 n=1 Tax=Anoplophora glabripennis TaxID=217634 RepID=UPI000873EB73|nr:uncharacterized protein LOC108912198 [Anoplophora glabripennis]
MSNFKFVVVCIAVLVASCVGSPVDVDTRLGDSHDINQCDPTTAKLNLLQTNIYEEAKLLQTVTRIVTYPESGLNTHPITCLKVTNTDTSDHGGYAEIVSGGIGAYDVQIRLTSQWNQPLKFRIEIWANEDEDPVTE